MKAIIDGKRYDTETATKVVVCEFMDCGSWTCETLYRTKRGNWFLCPSHWIGKSIQPISREKARQWLEKHNFEKELDEYFPGEIEDA